MDRLFDDFGGGLWRSPFCGSFDLPFQRTEQNLSAIPAVDVSDTDKAYEITAELPGMDEKTSRDSAAVLICANCGLLLPSRCWGLRGSVLCQ